jgi:DNA-binding HxlR family transcriptional regulator
VVTRPPVEHDERECQALVPVFSLLGKRWTGLIVNSLLAGPARFSELKRSVPGVTDQMLSERLNELAEAGLVEREVVEGPPVGTRYALTPRGEGLRPALAALEDWATEHLAPT